MPAALAVLLVLAPLAVLADPRAEPHAGPDVQPGAAGPTEPRVISCAPAGTLAIPRLGSPADDLVRIAELDGAVAPASRLIRRGGVREEPRCAGAAFPWGTSSLRPEPEDGAEDEPARPRPTLPREDGVRTLPFQLTTVWNSAYPAGDNDGLLWAGRGASQLATAGLTFRRGALSGALAPEVAWSQNRAFETVPTGREGALRYANPFYGDAIDLPQRFGERTVTALSPGQSFLRADLWNVALGVSTENLWLGPGVRNSILLSSAGPGFPHVFLGTSRPGDIVIGKAEALLFFGRLSRSEHVAAPTRPLVSGLVLTYEPRWIPGLHVGGGRVMLQRWDGLRGRDLLAIFQSFQKKDLESWYGEGGDNPEDNQLASLFVRWAFPQAGLEIYGEWAREDHEWDLGGLLREPDHSQAYLLGLQKVFRAGERRVRVLAELTRLQELRPLENRRGVPVYYTHGADLSYTNQGQLLGAWIGPGADSQTLAVDVLHAGGRIGGYVERVRRNDAYYWAVVEPQGGWWPHDTELSLGARQVLAVRGVEVSWEAAVGFRQNRDFLRNDKNLKAVIGVALPLGR